MSQPTVYIAYIFQEGPYGGSNQFARALKDHLENRKLLTTSAESADVILFLSHANLDEVVRLKKAFPNKFFVHRVDGPVWLHSQGSNYRDQVTHWANRNIADATIFQSGWSRYENYRLGFPKNPFETVIMNAALPALFNRFGKTTFSTDRKTRLIISSWSSNMAKGFEAYAWLDKNLDFSQFELTFVGNSPVPFKNIKQVSPLPPEQLALLLKEYDIYITASEKDACSNALIEGLSCGLPAIAKNDGGHPEIVKEGGELFGKPEQIPALLEQLIKEYHQYQRSIALPTMKEIGEAYMEFVTNVFNQPRTPKRLTKKALLQLSGMRLVDRVKNL